MRRHVTAPSTDRTIHRLIFGDAESAPEGEALLAAVFESLESKLLVQIGDPAAHDPAVGTPNVICLRAHGVSLHVTVKWLAADREHPSPRWLVTRVADQLM